MGKTIRGGKSWGYEYWSKRPSKGFTSPGKKTKKLTHHLERRRAKNNLRNIRED